MPPPPPPRSISLLSLLLSLPPIVVAFLSFPPHSHAGSHRRERTAAPRPVWNARKFWNLKPWRGYLPGGSPESVSSPKTRTRSVCFARTKTTQKYKLISGTARNIQATSLLLVVAPSAQFTVFSAPLPEFGRTRRTSADIRPLVSGLPVCSPRLPGATLPKLSCTTAPILDSELI